MDLKQKLDLWAAAKSGPDVLATLWPLVLACQGPGQQLLEAMAAIEAELSGDADL